MLGWMGSLSGEVTQSFSYLLPSSRGVYSSKRGKSTIFLNLLFILKKFSSPFTLFLYFKGVIVLIVVTLYLS